MNRTQLEHIIRAASRISGDDEIVVVGSQVVHAQEIRLPPIAYLSQEADVYPRNHPERADDIDFAIGELSPFHETFGYYAHGVSRTTAILPLGWERRLIRLSNPNTDGATGFCLDIHDLVLSKYAAGREKDIEFNRALVRYGCVTKTTKAAIRNFARSWIQELAPRRIRVNVLVPGATSTPGLHGLFPTEEVNRAVVAMMEAAAPAGRMGSPDEIANAALFLASDDSSFVNGSELFADGGAAQI